MRSNRVKGTHRMTGEDARNDGAAAGRRFRAEAARRWRWIAGGTLAGLLAATIFAFVVPPRYAGVAIVRLGPPAARDDPLVPADLARAAIDRLGLAADAEYAAGPDVLGAFLAHLSLAPAPESRATAITFVSRDPNLAARGANTVAELAAQAANEARARSVRAVETRLARKIEDGEAEVAAAGAKLEAARAQSNPPAAGAGPPDAAAGLEAKLSAARAAQSEAGEKAALLRKLAQGGRLADAPDTVADGPLRRLLDRRLALEAEIAEASRTLLPLHPRMKDLAAQRASLDVAIRDAADRAARAREADARKAGDEANALATQIAERSKAAADPAAAASLRRLEAEAQAARDELASWRQMAREQEAQAAADAEAGAARIVVRAEPPRAPVFPRIGQTFLMGGAAGFGLSSLAAVVSAFGAGRRRPSPYTMQQRAPATDAAPSTLDAPSKTGVPDPAPGAPPRTGGPDHVADLVAKLRRMKPNATLVALVGGDRTGRALAVALEAARGLAAERAAVFVDLGETQDWLADILYRDEADEPAILGLSDLLAGRAGFDAVIRRDLSTNLDVVLPGRDRAGGRIDDALTAFAAAYPAVILHASDWRSEWARAASAFADAVVVVAPAARAETVLDEARNALGGACPTILSFAIRAPQKTPEPAE